MTSQDYRVVPLPLLNATIGNVDVMARVSIIFNAQLSFEKLYTAWITALQEVPIMQAPIRKSDSAPSGLVYHVPTPSGMVKYLEQQRLAPDNQKDFYCLDESHRSINDYCTCFGTSPNAPSSTSQIVIAEGPTQGDVKRCTAFNAVDTTEELLYSNRPHNTIQVTRFSDATVITMSVTHAFGDLMTTKAYYKRWEAALYGKPIEPFKNEGVDPFAEYGPGGEFAKGASLAKPPPPPPGWHIYGLLDKVRFLKHHLWDQYVARPERTIQSKRIFIPEAQIKALEDSARYDLSLLQKRLESQTRPGDVKQKPLFVSRSDVVFAWLLKHSHARLPPEQESTALTISNGRFKPPAPLKAGADSLVNNDLLCGAMAIGLPSFKGGEVLAMSLGELALHVRNGIRANATPDRIRDWLVFHLFHSGWKKPSGQAVVPCKPHHFVTGITDWTLLHLEQLDFTPARLDANDKIPAIPFAMDGHMVVEGTRRDFYICMGDIAGGIWIIGFAGERQWSDPKSYGKYDAIQRGPKSKL